MSSSSSPSSPPSSVHAADPLIGRGRSMAAAMGMGADWDRVLSYIPASRLSTTEQQQRLLSMQMSMMMGVKTMQKRQPTSTAQRPQLPPQRLPTRWAKEEKKEEQEGEEEAEEEEEVDDSELVDEESDDEEIRTMKAELRQLRAEKKEPTQPSPPPQPSSHPQRVSAAFRPTDSDLVALVDKLTVAPSMDDPD